MATEARTSTKNYDSLQRLAEFKNEHYLKQGVRHVKIAIYAPGDLAFGIARMYDALAHQSPEEVRAFRDVRAAIRWLRE